MRMSVPSLVLPALLALAPVALTAQATADTPVAPVATAPAVPVADAPAAVPIAGPVAETQAVALKAKNAPVPAPAPRANTTNNRALMIVGGVGLIVGAVIGGDAGTIVMLGSAGVGLLGLYRFLN